MLDTLNKLRLINMLLCNKDFGNGEAFSKEMFISLFSKTSWMSALCNSQNFRHNNRTFALSLRDCEAKYHSSCALREGGVACSLSSVNYSETRQSWSSASSCIWNGRIALSSECITLPLALHVQQFEKDVVGWLHVPQRKPVIAFTIPGW